MKIEGLFRRPAAAALAAALAAAAVAAGGEGNPWDAARARALQRVPSAFLQRAPHGGEGGVARGLRSEHYGRSVTGPDGAERAPLLFRLEAKEANRGKDAVRMEGVDLYYMLGDVPMGAQAGKGPEDRKDAKGPKDRKDPKAAPALPAGSRLAVLAPHGTYWPSTGIGLAEGNVVLSVYPPEGEAALWRIETERLYWKYWEDDDRTSALILFTCDPDGKLEDPAVTGEFSNGDPKRPVRTRLSARGMIFESVVASPPGKPPKVERRHLVLRDRIRALIRGGGFAGAAPDGETKEAAQPRRTQIGCSGPGEVDLCYPLGEKETGRCFRFFDRVDCAQFPDPDRAGMTEVPVPDGADRVRCERLDLAYGPDDPGTHPRRAVAEGEVTYDGWRPEAGKEGKTKVRLSGAALALDGKSDQIRLAGSPARVVDGQGEFESPVIVYSRADQRISAPAGGAKRLVLKARPKPQAPGEKGGDAEAPRREEGAAPRGQGLPAIGAAELRANP